MQKYSRKQWFYAGVAGAACALLLAGFTNALLQKGLASSEVAGWVQAIGATVAIGIAIWVPYDQARQAAIRDERMGREGAARLCLSLKDELELLQVTFDTPNVREILRDAPGEIFDTEIPIPADRFPIYRSLVSRLTELEDAALRKNIAVSYQLAQQVIELGELNNRQLRIRTELARVNSLSSGIHTSELEHQYVQLTNLRVKMKNLVRATIGTVALTIEHLEKTAKTLMSAQTQSSTSQQIEE